MLWPQLHVCESQCGQWELHVYSGEQHVVLVALVAKLY